MSRLIFRAGKAILRVYELPEGGRLLEKTVDQKLEHIMRMTGAPGWDKAAVDDVFGEGVEGSLRYVYQGVRHDIDIVAFRKHAFEKTIGTFGPQYHVNTSHYKTTGLRTVEPTRELEPEPLPKRMAFGEWLPCGSCQGRGKNCKVCSHLGYVEWRKLDESPKRTPDQTV